MAGFMGSFTLLVTPFDAEGRLDVPSLDRLVAHHVQARAQGLFAVCGTSEMAALGAEERLCVAHSAARRASGALPVLAAANLDEDPAHHGEQVARMSQSGVDGVVLVPPRRHSGEADALLDYLGGLARRSAVPVLLYEWPGSSPAEIPAAVFGRLHAEAGVVGLKDTTCSLEAISAKIASAPAATVFQANNPLLLAAFDLGARGSMSIASAVRPDLLAALWDEYAAGRRSTALRLEREIVFLDAVLGGFHPGGAKWLLQRQGLIAHDRCRSGRPPSEAGAAALRAWERQAPAWRGD